MNKPLVAFAALAACAVALPALAQPSTNDENQVLLSQIQTDKRAIVLRGMGLTDAESAGFIPIYDEYQAEQKKLADRTIAVLNKFASNYDSMTDDAANSILKDWLGIEDAGIALTKKYAKRFGKVLPATKVLRFVQIENKLNTVLELQAVRAVPLAQP
jgi:hypothetical protein